jgi:hypothetical protein
MTVSYRETERYKQACFTGVGRGQGSTHVIVL